MLSCSSGFISPPSVRPPAHPLNSHLPIPCQRFERFVHGRPRNSHDAQGIGPPAPPPGPGHRGSAAARPPPSFAMSTASSHRPGSARFTDVAFGSKCTPSELRDSVRLVTAAVDLWDRSLWLLGRVSQALRRHQAGGALLAGAPAACRARAEGGGNCPHGPPRPLVSLLPASPSPASRPRPQEDPRPRHPVSRPLFLRGSASFSPRFGSPWPLPGGTGAKSSL